jgi:hypothetical protein
MSMRRFINLCENCGWREVINVYAEPFASFEPGTHRPPCHSRGLCPDCGQALIGVVGVEGCGHRPSGRVRPTYPEQSECADCGEWYVAGSVRGTDF